MILVYIGYTFGRPKGNYRKDIRPRIGRFIVNIRPPPPAYVVYRIPFLTLFRQARPALLKCNISSSLNFDLSSPWGVSGSSFFIRVTSSSRLNVGRIFLIESIKCFRATFYSVFLNYITMFGSRISAVVLYSRPKKLICPPLLRNIAPGVCTICQYEFLAMRKT